MTTDNRAGAVLFGQPLHAPVTVHKPTHAVEMPTKGPKSKGSGSR